MTPNLYTPYSMDLTPLNLLLQAKSKDFVLKVCLQAVNKVTWSCRGGGG